MKLPIKPWQISVLVSGLCLASVIKPAAQAESSLKNLDIEAAEAKVAFDSVVTEANSLREKVAVLEGTVAALQKNLAMTSTEAEVFRRKASELNVRLEALGTGKVDDRLIKLLNELKLADAERKALRDALLALAEAVLRYQKVAATDDATARLDLEAGMRGASKALGVAPLDTPAAAAVPSSLADGMVISVKQDLALVVANVGSHQGVKVGMPFEVVRGESVIGSVRMVDVREKIAGALIQNLSDKEKIKIGDRLKVAVQQ
jgi:hypothetical protein